MVDNSILLEFGYRPPSPPRLTLVQSEIMKRLLYAQKLIANEVTKWEATSGTVTQQRLASSIGVP
jgi:hypothetical protein